MIKKFYSSLFYFELGRNTASRFYGWLPEIIIILGGLKYLLKVELSTTAMLVLFLLITLLFLSIGFFIKESGLYDIDRYVQADKDPVMHELLEHVRR